MKEKFLYECSIVFLILVCLTCTSSLKQKNRRCTQTGPCVCSFPSGSKINISQLADHDFGWIKFNATTDILFNPCTNKSVGNNHTDECFDGASVCLRVNHTGNVSQYFNLGKTTDATFTSDVLTVPASLQFRKNDTLTIIELHCTDKAFQPSLIAKEDKKNYVLQLRSYQSCPVLGDGPAPTVPSGLSTGSFIVITFFIFTLIYFIGGILTLKFLRGAEGKEMIPNYDFWADLPYLVRDGVLFTLNGCQPIPSYDRI